MADFADDQFPGLPDDGLPGLPKDGFVNGPTVPPIAKTGSVAKDTNRPSQVGTLAPEDYVNPPADSRLNSILSIKGSGLRQGIIVQTNDVLKGTSQKRPFAVRFMFNPTTLSFGYQAKASTYTEAEKTPEARESTDLTSGETSLSFELLFDRTYDVAYGPEPGRRDLRRMGVLADIRALECLTGVYYPWADAPEAVVGSMRLIPCYFIFGGGRDNVGVTFIGTITNWDVTYTSFTEDMIPNRARVSIGAMHLKGRLLPSSASDSYLWSAWKAQNPQYRNLTE